MDFGKSIGLVAIAAIGGLAFYFFTRKSGSGTGAGGTITIGDETYPIPTEPGTYVFPGNGGNGDNGMLVPEYVPPPTYPTQAPTADELYPLGTPENPLYAEIPGELIPHSGPGGWYEIRNIEETLGWTPERFQEEMAIIRTTPSDERTVEQQYAGGYADTMEQAQRGVDFKERVKLYGGDYVGGILVPPDNWGGSVTEFSKYVRASIDR